MILPLHAPLPYMFNSKEMLLDFMGPFKFLSQILIEGLQKMFLELLGFVWTFLCKFLIRSRWEMLSTKKPMGYVPGINSLCWFAFNSLFNHSRKPMGNVPGAPWAKSSTLPHEILIGDVCGMSLELSAVIASYILWSLLEVNGTWSIRVPYQILIRNL